MNNNSSVTIRIGCGFAGVTSTEVSTIQRLIATKSDVLLRKKLFSSNKTEAVLVAILLKHRQAKGEVQLSQQETQQINAIAGWDEPYSVCYGCTEHFEGRLSELLTNGSDAAHLLLCKAVLKLD